MLVMGKDGVARQLDLKVARTLMGGDKSEFGHGFIQNLFYFAEHLGNSRALSIGRFAAYLEGTLKRIDVEGDCYLEFAYSKGSPSHGEPYNEQSGLNQSISSFMNGASDHLYEFEIPESLPDEIKGMAKEMRELSLDMGHGSGLMDAEGKVCNIDNFRRVKELTIEIARALDFVVFGIVGDEGEYQ